MSQLRLALAQINPTVGALQRNAELILEQCQLARDAGCDVVAFPEMALTGYPVEDLALRQSFMDASRQMGHNLVERLTAEGLGDLVVVFGLLDHLPASTAGEGVEAAQNAAWVVHRGEITHRYAKHHLPNYGVFDEQRYFTPGSRPGVFEVNGVRVSLAICEDLWQDGGPVQWARNASADLLLVLNGSPYERAKDDARLTLCQQRAAESGCVLAYVNLVGGQDELVFDGDSMVVAPGGSVAARAQQFTPELLVLDLDTNAGGTPQVREVGPQSAPTPRLDSYAELWGALVLGLRDYVAKNGFASVVLGLSGGIDSAVVAAIACDAVGAGNVHGVSLPSRYSSQHSRDDAQLTAQRTGLRYRCVEIEPMVAAYEANLHLTDLAAENLQARVRGVTLMAISNQEGHLVLATGNKTELSVGYSTIYGDAVGGFAPIKDVAKTEVWQLARWRNQHARSLGDPEPIPASSIDKPPSAELRPGQLDADSLPDYELLDDVLDVYVERGEGAADLVSGGFDAELVQRIIRMTDIAEYKRRQYPPGTKVSSRAFGRDRRLPITNRWRESMQ